MIEGTLTQTSFSNGDPTVTYAYDSLGRGTSLTRANVRVTNLAYDPISRLASYDHVGLVNASFTYNLASQLVTRILSNDNYAFTGDVNVNRNYTVNNLNQYTSAGPASFTYDNNGNLTGDGSNSFVYDALNRLTSRSGGGTAASRSTWLTHSG